MGIFSKISKGLQKTRLSMAGAIDNVLHGVNEITDEMFDDLEEILVMGDVGVTTATEIVDRLRAKVAKDNLRNGEQVRKAIKQIVAELLDGGEQMEMITMPSIGTFSPAPTTIISPISTSSGSTFLSFPSVSRFA